MARRRREDEENLITAYEKLHTGEHRTDFSPVTSATGGVWGRAKEKMADLFGTPEARRATGYEATPEVVSNQAAGPAQNFMERWKGVPRSNIITDTMAKMPEVAWDSFASALLKVGETTGEPVEKVFQNMMYFFTGMGDYRDPPFTGPEWQDRTYPEGAAATTTPVHKIRGAIPRPPTAGEPDDLGRPTAGRPEVTSPELRAKMGAPSPEIIELIRGTKRTYWRGHPDADRQIKVPVGRTGTAADQMKTVTPGSFGGDEFTTRERAVEGKWPIGTEKQEAEALETARDMAVERERTARYTAVAKLGATTKKGTKMTADSEGGVYVMTDDGIPVHFSGDELGTAWKKVFNVLLSKEDYQGIAAILASVQDSALRQSIIDDLSSTEGGREILSRLVTSGALKEGPAIAAEAKKAGAHIEEIDKKGKRTKIR
jgi:hypothetical protein